LQFLIAMPKEKRNRRAEEKQDATISRIKRKKKEGLTVPRRKERKKGKAPLWMTDRRKSTPLSLRAKCPRFIDRMLRGRKSEKSTRKKVKLNRGGI